MDLKEYLSNLEYLVNIDSETRDVDGVNKVADFFSKAFTDMGWNVKEYYHEDGEYGKCVVCTNREAEHYDLILIGHTDTVYAKGTAVERPFRVEGNIAYGPGVCDMKHGCLLMYYLLKELPQEINDTLNIVAVFNPDEEIGSRFSRNVYAEYAKKTDYAFLYEAGNEKTGCCTQRKGTIVYMVEFTGKAGHSGNVQGSDARSAVHEMGKWIVMFDEMNDWDNDTTVNVGIANGGERGNVVAPSANIKVDIRYSDKNEIERFDKAVENMKKGAKSRGIDVNVIKLEKKPFTRTAKADAYIKHIEKITSENGITFKHAARGGVSDANILADYDVICVDGLGPEGTLAHSPDEYMNIDSVIPYYNLSAFLIKDLADNKKRNV